MSDKRAELEGGVEFISKDGPQRTTEAKEILQALEEYREFIESNGRKWDTKEALTAMQIDPGWFYEPILSDLITKFLYYRHAPHQAFEGTQEQHPHIWVESCLLLDGVFGVSL